MGWGGGCIADWGGLRRAANEEGWGGDLLVEGWGGAVWGEGEDPEVVGGEGGGGDVDVPLVEVCCCYVDAAWIEGLVRTGFFSPGISIDWGCGGLLAILYL